jgi:uncharacterized phage protein gp47/JayE
MVEKRITYFERDGIRRTMILDDEHPGRVVVHAEQDIEQITAGIARDRELLNQRGDMKMVARIPAVHADRVIGMDPDELKHFLNDSDNEAFRIWKGKL